MTYLRRLRLAARAAAMMALFACAATAMGGGRACAEETAVPQGLRGEALHKQVDVWIRALGADGFAVREAARAGLTAYAEAARAQLEAAAQHDDAEVARSVRALLAQSAGGVPAAPAAITLSGRRDVAQLGLVTFRTGGEVGAEAALQAFGAEHGGAYRVPPEAAERPIEVELVGVPWFTALEALLEPAGLTLLRSFDASGSARLRMQEAAVEAAVPQAHVGPFRVRVVEVVRRRSLTRDDPASYVLSLEVAWAPTIEVLQFENPRVVSARTPDGKAMEAPAVGRRTYGLGRATYQTRIDVHLRAPADAEIPALQLLELEVPLRLRHGLASLWLRPPEDLPQTVRGEGTAAPEATFEALEGETGGRRGWLAEVRAKLPSAGAAATAHVLAETVAGARVRMHVAGGRSGSADGTVHLTARAWRIGSERPRALGLAWFQHEEHGLLRVRLQDVPLR